MNVNVMLFKEFFRHIIRFTDRANITDSRSGRLFHDISHLTGEDQFSFSRHNTYLYFQCIPANTCPCKTSHDSNFIFRVCHMNGVFFFSRIFFQIPVCDLNFLFIAFVNLSCRFTADCPDFSFQLTYSGFFCVVLCKLPHYFFADRKLIFLKSMLFNLLRN